jgi:hypothetical protein
MLSDWVSFLAYPNLFGIKGIVVAAAIMLYASDCNYIAFLRVCTVSKISQQSWR